MLRIISIFLFLWVCNSSFAQQIIEAIDVVGNKRTHEKIILREIDFVVGQTVSANELEVRITKNEKRLLDTGLFTEVEISLKEQKLIILLQENWYIYPRFIFELADRNFSVWWKEQNRSLSRVNYGVSLSHINLTGNRDPLKLSVQSGYTNRYELQYSYPYLNRAKTIGAATVVQYSERKEIAYKTENNKTLFESYNEEIVLRRFRTGLRLNYRPNFNAYHTFNLEFHHNRIHEHVAQQLNPDYFLAAAEGIRFFYLEYDFKIDKRIFRLYPESGTFWQFNLKKEGLGIFGEYNNLSAFVVHEQYIKLHEKLTAQFSAKAKANLIREKVGFANNTGLGWGDDFIKGYELYVVDGVDFLLSKNSLRFQLVKTNFHFGKWMFLSQFKHLHFQLYLTANFDAGYVNEPTYNETNSFTNRWLFGYGPGIDALLYNNFLLRFEYSFNHLQESGLNFRFKKSF